jgi:hypothetical protein
MPQVVVGEVEGVGEDPAFTVVEVEEGVEAEAFEVVEGDEREDGVAQFGVFCIPRLMRVKPWKISFLG